jgi:ribonuclease HI
MNFTPDITIYTDGSTAPGNPGPSGYGFFAVTDTKIYNGFGPVSIRATNNEAELTAVIKSIEYVNYLNKYSSLLLLSDSKYVVDGINSLDKWERNNWMTASGTLLANVGLWEDIKKAITKFKLNGNKFVTKWVKGHDGNIGNEQADQNANKGRIGVLTGKSEHTCVIENRLQAEYKNDVLAAESIVNGSKVVSKPFNLTPLLSGKKWFFNTNLKNHLTEGRYFYTTSTYENKKLDNNKNIGKRNPDTHYAIYITDYLIGELEAIRDQYNNSLSDMIVPIIIDLASVKKNLPTIADKSKLKEVITIKGNMAVTADSSVLGTVVTPPKLIFKLEGIFNYGFTLLNKFVTKADDVAIVDITEHFFTVSAKGKQNLHVDFKNDLKTMVVDNIPLNNSIVTIKLNLGVDIPLRNNFLALIKQKSSLLKVFSVMFEITENSYRVATIIQCDNDIGIYFTPDANYRIIKI